MNNIPYIYIHADDYGMTPRSSARIEECYKDGCLNSVSVMPNGCTNNSFEACKKMNIPTVVHLNIVEGKCLSPKEEVPLLVRKDGYFKYSFFDLLRMSISSKRQEMKKQVMLEFRYQIRKVQEGLQDNAAIMLDSHQHIHMIPLIFDTMMEIISQDKLNVGYLRIPAEPIMPFLMTPSLYRTYKPINLVKNVVLNVCWLFDRRKFHWEEIPTAIFCGIIFSGYMDVERVKKIFPHFYKKAVRKHMNLEFLFHPGYINQGELVMDAHKHCFNNFYLSEGRRVEYQALHDEEFCNMINKKNEKYLDQFEAVQEQIIENI